LVLSDDCLARETALQWLMPARLAVDVAGPAPLSDAETVSLRVTVIEIDPAITNAAVG
jgi:hypothetical protein